MWTYVNNRLVRYNHSQPKQTQQTLYTPVPAVFGRAVQDLPETEKIPSSTPKERFVSRKSWAASYIIGGRETWQYLHLWVILHHNNRRQRKIANFLLSCLVGCPWIGEKVFWITASYAGYSVLALLIVVMAFLLSMTWWHCVGVVTLLSFYFFW